jgi:hypothetical protein
MSIWVGAKRSGFVIRPFGLRIAAGFERPYAIRQFSRVRIGRSYAIYAAAFGVLFTFGLSLRSKNQYLRTANNG